MTTLSIERDPLRPRWALARLSIPCGPWRWEADGGLPTTPAISDTILARGILADHRRNCGCAATADLEARYGPVPQW